MFYINDDYYSANYVAQHHSEFKQSGILNKAKRLAVCIEDTAQWLAFLLLIKEHKCSVMPIHPNTPINAARRLALNAGCEQLIFKDISNIIRLDTKVSKPNHLTPSEGGLIQMSSGTTGTPKCIERSWKSIDEEIKSYCSTFTSPNDMTPLIACPVTHSYGLICGVLVALARGLEPIIITNINPKYLVKRLFNSVRPLLYTSPTMLYGLIRLLPKDKNIYAAMTSGTMMPKQRFELLAPRIDHFFQQYGCSEAGCIAINPNLSSSVDVGIPLPHLNVSAGKNADNPAEIIVTTEDGLIIHTQDLGYFHHNDGAKLNMLSFLSRMDDTIIVAGLNVYPQDVEDIILAMPNINDAVVFKIDDHYAGQRVCLQYSADTPLDPTLIREWCTQHLATYQLPQQLIQVEQIERLPNGKVNRQQLAAQFEKARAEQKNALNVHASQTETAL